MIVPELSEHLDKLPIDKLINRLKEEASLGIISNDESKQIIVELTALKEKNSQESTIKIRYEE